MAFLTNGACRIYTPTSGRPLSPKFGQGGGKGGRRPLSRSLDILLFKTTGSVPISHRGDFYGCIFVILLLMNGYTVKTMGYKDC